MADLTGRLLAVDPQVCKIVQRPECELVGMTYQALTHPDDLLRNIDLIEKLGASSGPLQIRKRYLRPDGSVVWADVHVSRLGEMPDGRLVGTITMLDGDGSDRDPESRWRSARARLAVIAHQRSEFGNDLVSDHLHSIMLHLYVAEAEGRVVDIGELSERCEAPAPVVTRWLQVLVDRGLVDDFDAAGRSLQFTVLGVRKMERLLDFQPGI